MTPTRSALQQYQSQLVVVRQERNDVCQEEFSQGATGRTEAFFASGCAGATAANKLIFLCKGSFIQNQLRLMFVEQVSQVREQVLDLAPEAEDLAADSRDMYTVLRTEFREYPSVQQKNSPLAQRR